MTFQLTDFPRILPELLLVAVAILVVGSDVLERWGADPAAQEERGRSAVQLTLIGLGLVFVVALVQSRYLFTVGAPLPGDGILERIGNTFINLGRNLQAAGPGGEPILGAFATDDLTVIARLILVGGAFLVVLLAADYRPTGSPGEFYALILFATAGMCLMAAATELILAFVALELASLSLYVLAGYFRSEPRSAEAGMKYFVFGALSSGILLYGMSLAYGATAAFVNAGGAVGSISTLYSEIARAAAAAGTGGAVITLAMLLIVAGAGYKIAVVPFHGWAPDVYQGAPTPMTAFIASASKVAGFLLLYRLLVTAFPALAGTPNLQRGAYGWTSLLALLALLTVIVGTMAALPQTDAKRLLGWSSIGHAGFALLALILWSSTALGARAFAGTALLYYLLVYALTTAGAFGALAAVERVGGGSRLADLNGLWRRNIGLALILSLLVLSLAGIPPLSGFWAKFFVFMAGYQAGALPLVIVAVIMTIVSLYYYLRILKAIWIERPPSTEPLRTPRAMGVALAVATALVVLLGILPNLALGVFEQAAAVAGR